MIFRIFRIFESRVEMEMKKDLLFIILPHIGQPAAVWVVECWSRKDL